uniref:Integrase catalytic domain-containing protein n=1 Tax=Anopheles christyi TaxID=43041 RepID=A0A182K8L8_9DIPT
MATKAIHLEAASNLSTEAFLPSLRRFIGRRGLIQQLHSDNATNFRGAQHELHQLYQQSSQHIMLRSSEVYGKQLPSAAVKSTKTHLRRVIGTSRLSFEELSNVLVQVEVQYSNYCVILHVPGVETTKTPCNPGRIVKVNVREGMIVVLQDRNLPPLEWQIVVGGL